MNVVSGRVIFMSIAISVTVKKILVYGVERGAISRPPSFGPIGVSL